MTTRIVMAASAVVMGLAGLAATFLPQEILALAGMEPERAPVLFLEIGGALYLGFAMLNWMARGNLIGGIYSRPVAMGNFLHFSIGAITLIKGAVDASGWELLAAALLYAVMAAAFGAVIFGNPLTRKSPVR